jgi:glycosyltransferase involved in cell wall biosynthesis
MVVHGPYPIGEGRVAREALAAIEAGWEVDVVAMRRAGEPADETIDSVRIFRLPLSHTRGGSALATVHEYLGFTFLAAARVVALSRGRRYQIVHVHNPPDFLVVAALVPRLLGARVILDIHDFAPLVFALRFGRRRGMATVERFLQMVERIAAEFASAVITVHDPYRRALVSRGVSAEKITVILNSVDERLLPSEEPGPIESSQDFRVVYHGTVTPVYGVELLVEAAGLLAQDEPNLRVEIYGEGDALERVRARVADLGISDRVYLSGRYLPAADVLERVRFASVGVIPNLPSVWSEGTLPTKLLEYAVLGVPIVSADLPTIRAHFSADEVRFFPAGDAAALAQALRDVAAHPDAAQARAAAARRRYEEYRWDYSAARYVALLERLLRGRHRLEAASQ